MPRRNCEQHQTPVKFVMTVKFCMHLPINPRNDLTLHTVLSKCYLLVHAAIYGKKTERNLGSQSLKTSFSKSIKLSLQSLRRRRFKSHHYQLPHIPLDVITFHNCEPHVNPVKFVMTGQYCMQQPVKPTMRKKPSLTKGKHFIRPKFETLALKQKNGDMCQGN